MSCMAVERERGRVGGWQRGRGGGEGGDGGWRGGVILPCSYDTTYTHLQIPVICARKVSVDPKRSNTINSMQSGGFHREGGGTGGTGERGGGGVTLSKAR